MTEEIINNKKYYSAKELAKILSYNVMTIYRYIKQGKLRALRFGKEFRIEKNDWENFIKKIEEIK
jgi:excisionase family DNA binding protein